MAAIPGIPGAGDLVHAGKRLYQATEALSDGPDGARRHYQQATSGLAQRVRAEEDWIAATTDPATVEALELVKNMDRDLQDQLARSGKHLGRGAKSGFHHGTLNKLNFGFNTDKTIREHHDRLQPAREAANMRIALMNANKTEARFDQQDITEALHFKELKMMSKSLLRQLSNVATRQDMLALHHRISQFQLSPTTLALPLADGTPPRPSTHTSAPTSTSITRSPIAAIRDCVQSVIDFVSANSTDATRRNTLEVAKLLFALAITAAYRAIRPPKASSAGITATADDILRACIVGYAVLALLSSIRHVPRLIEGLGDHTITMQTALGEELKIPELYSKSHHTLHGYLQYYFEDRPGRDWVDRKNYRLLIGGTGGMVIEESKWSAVLSRHTQLTMAFLIGESGRCPKCRHTLEARGRDWKYCKPCDKCFASIPQSPTPSVESDVYAKASKVSPLWDNSHLALESALVPLSSEMAHFVHVLLLDMASSSIRRPQTTHLKRATVGNPEGVVQDVRSELHSLGYDDFVDECPICMDPCKNPRVFACGHSVCKECFIALCKHALERTTDAEPRCPACRTKLIGTGRVASAAQSSDRADFDIGFPMGSTQAKTAHPERDKRQLEQALATDHEEDGISELEALLSSDDDIITGGTFGLGVSLTANEDSEVSEEE